MLFVALCELQVTKIRYTNMGIFLPLVTNKKSLYTSSLHASVYGSLFASVSKHVMSNGISPSLS